MIFTTPTRVLVFIVLLVSQRVVISTKYEFCDVVVVGAGYAGLTSARWLSKQNLTVSVLEGTGSKTLDGK